MPSNHSRRRACILAGFLALGIAGIRFWLKAPGEVRVTPPELRRSELTLREGRLYAEGDPKPFTGLLYDTSSPGVRKLEIEIRDGKAHGRSYGYRENGGLEVEEFFTEGVSHGVRTRWDEQGRKKSTTQIEHGKLNGPYLEWHDNGKKAVEMTLRNDQPEGVAEAWHPNGELKSRTRFVDGKMVERKFFPDSTQTVNAAESP